MSAAIGLERQFRNSDSVHIILLDREPYHLIYNNLYEVAAAAEELVSAKQLKKSAALPFEDALSGRKIKFIQSEVKVVDPHGRTIQLSGRQIEYDYLILALGFCEEYFNIPGAREFGIPLRTLTHAFKIKNAVEFAVEAHKFDAQKNFVRVVVAGGGYTGVELAAELAGLFNFLAWKHQYPRHKIEIQIVEAGNRLMEGMGERANRDACWRLAKLGVKIKFSAPITQVKEHTLELLTGERLVYDVLIWAAGIRAKPLPKGLNFKTDSRGRVEVDEFLRVKNQHNIFVLGDQALVLKPNGQPAPQSAQDAIHQAQYLASALPVLMHNRRPKSYMPPEHGFIVTLGGQWAILNYPPIYFTGRLAYLAHQLALLRYFARLCGWWKALKLVWFQSKLYATND